MNDEIKVEGGQVLVTTSFDVETYRADLLSKKEVAENAVNDSNSIIANEEAKKKISQDIVDDCDAKLAQLPAVEDNQA